MSRIYQYQYQRKAYIEDNTTDPANSSSNPPSPLTLSPPAHINSATAQRAKAVYRPHFHVQRQWNGRWPSKCNG
eukprot:scaffold263145_cov39-Tisochrysis_lutea.AAC.1